MVSGIGMAQKSLLLIATDAKRAKGALYIRTTGDQDHHAYPSNQITAFNIIDIFCFHPPLNLLTGSEWHCKASRMHMQI